MDEIRAQIKEIVDRETLAWDTQDVDLLLTIFHQDMVWPWPKTPNSHGPMEWILKQGRFNYDRWKNDYSELFRTHKLTHNHRVIKKIVVSDQMDGALAVVDIDTLWVSRSGQENHWKGRVCKVYAKRKSRKSML